MRTAVNESDLSRIDPHRTGLFAGILLGGASITFALIAAIILLSGNEAFAVVDLGLGIENKYARLMTLPFVLFIGVYLFAYSICTLIRLTARYRR